MNKNDALMNLLRHLPDMIDYDAMTPELADTIMTLARSLDPAESDIAAYIRDALRDNIDYDDRYQGII